VQFVFGDYLLDVGRRELQRGADRVAIEPQVFDLLVYIIQNRDRVVSKEDLIAAIWKGRIVSDSTLTSRINAARKALGDNGEQQAIIRTISRKGIRFVAQVNDQAKTPSALAARSPLRQEIHFCTASDGARIAYAAVGDGPPIIKAGNWLNHLEYDWENPIWSHLLHKIAATNRLIRYDQRGNGLSTGTSRKSHSTLTCAILKRWSRQAGSSVSRCWGSRRGAPHRSLTRFVIPSV
jgi:DNA-binding winged helix-turn-helix (wHTH) protein